MNHGRASELRSSSRFQTDFGKHPEILGPTTAPYHLQGDVTQLVVLLIAVFKNPYYTYVLCTVKKGDTLLLVVAVTVLASAGRLFLLRILL